MSMDNSRESLTPRGRSEVPEASGRECVGAGSASAHDRLLPSGGSAGTTEPYPPAGPAMMHQVNHSHYVAMLSTKSVGAAIALSFFFGPLGMLYATVTGALVMFFVNLVVGFFTLGLGLFLTWPICVVWAAVAANDHNDRIAGAVARSMGRP